MRYKHAAQTKALGTKLRYLANGLTSQSPRFSPLAVSQHRLDTRESAEVAACLENLERVYMLTDNRSFSPKHRDMRER